MAPNLQELQRIQRLVDTNLKNWQVAALCVPAPEPVGADQLAVLVARGCKRAAAIQSALRRALAPDIGWPFRIAAPEPLMVDLDVFVDDEPAICIEPGCNGKQKARGLCARHLAQFHRRQKRQLPRSACIDGYKNHRFSHNNICVRCKHGRSP